MQDRYIKSIFHPPLSSGGSVFLCPEISPFSHQSTFLQTGSPVISTCLHHLTNQHVTTALTSRVTSSQDIHLVFVSHQGLLFPNITSCRFWEAGFLILFGNSAIFVPNTLVISDRTKLYVCGLCRWVCMISYTNLLLNFGVMKNVTIFFQVNSHKTLQLLALHFDLHITNHSSSVIHSLNSFSPLLFHT